MWFVVESQNSIVLRDYLGTSKIWFLNVFGIFYLVIGGWDSEKCAGATFFSLRIFDWFFSNLVWVWRYLGECCEIFSDFLNPKHDFLMVFENFIRRTCRSLPFLRKNTKKILETIKSILHRPYFFQIFCGWVAPPIAFKNRNYLVCKGMQEISLVNLPRWNFDMILTVGLMK